MQKIEEQEYLRKALKIWGINENYINDRIKDRMGITPIEKLYEYYQEGVNSELVFNDDGRIDLEKMKFEKSMIEVNNSSKAYGWIIFPDLSTGMLKASLEMLNNDKEAGERARYATLVSMIIARKLGIESADYYLTTNTINDKVKNELGYIYTPNFLKENEEFISGLNINYDNVVMNKLRGDLNSWDMEHNERALKTYLNNRRFSTKEVEDVRQNFIKQCIISKILRNTDEAGRNWGIIVSNNVEQDETIKRNVKMAPMYDLESCLQDKYRNDFREVNGSQDLSDFIKHYSNEEWFNEWINDKVFNLDMNEVYKDIINESKIQIPDNYQEEFNSKIKTSINEIKEVYNNKEIEQEER